MTQSPPPTGLPHKATGISGFDAVTHGGPPARGATMIAGAAGSGKTVFALNVVANAVRAGGRCIFISFEESPAEILRNTAAFDWRLDEHVDAGLTLIDARPRDDVVVAGEFDIGGLLAVLADQVAREPPDWVVFDGIDQLIAPARDGHRTQAVGEVRRLHRWLDEQGLTGLLTAKETPLGSEQHLFLDDLQFLFSTVVILSGEIVGRRLSRKLRVAKFRGSAHVTDEVPLVIDAAGVHVPYYGDTKNDWRALAERISTGVPRLDELVGGGYFRGSGILISGEPGTSKTSLSAAFVAAAAARGEKALFISFDEAAAQIVRNVRSIGIDLQSPIDEGALAIRTLRPGDHLVETHYLEVLALLERERPECLVIDPVSALLKAGGDAAPYLSLERLLDTIKSRGITTLMTSLVAPSQGVEDLTAAHVSTIADTWITLNNRVLNGERNRALSIVKSRGTRHSNQMRELILSERGIELADVYAFGSEVLMGTARVHKEHEEALARKREQIERQRRRQELQQRIEEAEAKRRSVEWEVEALRRSLAVEDELQQAEVSDRGRWQEEVMRSRTGSADADPGSDREER